MLTRERRRHKRYPVDLPARFRIVPPSQPDRASPFQTARLADISEGGARLLTNCVRVGDLHIFHPSFPASEQCVLDLEVGEGDALQVFRAQVMWYDHAAEGTPFTFQAGLQFIETTADRQEEIRACVERLRRNRC